MAQGLLVKEGYTYGEWRKAINAAARAGAGSIHDDATGRRVGMRGGVVAGTVHHDIFPPLMLKVFGQRWFEQGSISLFYLYAMVAGEELRGVVEIPPPNAPNAQVQVRLEGKDGHKIAEGTASVGKPKEKSHLQAMEITSAGKEERRILKAFDVGMDMVQNEATITKKEVEAGLSFLEDTIPWYSGNSPWGGSLVPNSWIYRFAHMPRNIVQGVGFFGANEIQFVNGPVKADVPYVCKGKIIAVGVTNKTEYFWHDSQIYERNTNKPVATIRHMNRFMKQGSPLYPEIPAGK